MIRNIVFDMGKVLVEYDAMRVCRHHIADEADRQQVCTAVFVSPEWVLLDMGVISEKQALRQMCGRLPERLHEAAALCMRDWHKYCMETVPEMDPLIRELKAQGFGIYLCSNAGVRLLECYREVIPAVECFDGILFSAAEKCIKPQKEIFEHFFQKFDLKPEACFFVDDLQLNIDGAKACGMDGYCFADRNLERLKVRLAGLAADMRNGK